MIGLDTNVLARYYVNGKADDATQRQREAARRLIESGQPLMVCKTVMLELEWLLHGYYRYAPPEVLAVLHHLITLPNIAIEDSRTVRQALANCAAGIDFADALHHASYRACTSMASFDDRRFARHAKKLGLSPSVVVPVARK